MRKVLIAKTDAIGDLILALPVARSIKEKHSDLQLTMLVSDYTRELLEQESYIDDVISIPARSLRSIGEFQRFTQTLRVSAFDTALLLYPRFGLALACTLAGIPLRAGTAYRFYSFLFSKPVRLHRRNSGKHELDLNYELAESIFTRLPRHEPHLSVSAEHLKAARCQLTAADLDPEAEYVIVHPLSRGSAPNWPLNNYLDLADRIAEAGLRVLFTGSAGERPLIATAIASRGTRHVNLAGATGLGGLIGLIAKALMVITGSTGPIHIATAVRTFAVGFYPPQSELSATRWGPRGGANKLFVPRVDNVDGANADCLEQVTVAGVAAYVLSKIENIRNISGEQQAH